MECVDIGGADPDIAGIGVITAFAFQAIASYLLSLILLWIFPKEDTSAKQDSIALDESTPEFPALLEKLKRFAQGQILDDRSGRSSVDQDAASKNSIDGSLTAGDPVDENTTSGAAVGGASIADAAIDGSIANAGPMPASDNIARVESSVDERSSSAAVADAQNSRVQTRNHYRQANGTDAIRIAREVQRFLFGAIEAAGDPALTRSMSYSAVLPPPKLSKAREAGYILAKILNASNDAQTLAGIALALTGLVRQASLSLYQLHLIYDTINLTSVSNCAVLLAATTVTTAELPSKVILMLVFAVVYFAFVIVFGLRLGQWDETVPGFCYKTDFLAAADAPHPLVDKVYLAITCLYMYTALIGSLIVALARYYGVGSLSPPTALAQFWTLDRPLSLSLVGSSAIFNIIALQLPLHLYYMIRLRITNEPALIDGQEENQWGFGQVFVLIMSAGLVTECVKGYLEYRSLSKAEPADDASDTVNLT